MDRRRKRISRARLAHAHNVAAGTAARRQHRFLVADNAAGLGAAAVYSEEEWHEKILSE
jgi:hypothetical protein